MIPLLVPIGLGLIGGYLSQDSTQTFAGGGGVSDRIYLPKGYTFVVVGSHRSKQQLNRYAVEYISLYKIGGSQGTSGTYTLLMSNNDYEKIKNIRGVTKKEYLKSDVHWFSRKESDKINKVFQKIEQKYSGGGGVDDDLEYKRRIKKFGFKPYGKTKGRYTVSFIQDGKEQKEIWQSKEMAIDTAKRYSKLFTSVKVTDEKNKEIKYAGGGKVKRKDLFETPEMIPKKVSKIIDRYWEEYGDDMDYEDTERMRKEVEAVGYTFDYGLDNVPMGLRPINVSINELDGYEEYSKGGGVDNKV
jgi:hypothetical protein